MIENERQYELTRAQVAQFARALAEMEEKPQDAPEIDPVIQEAIRRGMQSQLDELTEDLNAYESGRRRPDLPSADAEFAQLPEALIRAREAAGLTQQDLALRLGIKEYQVRRYESTGYAGASIDRIRAVIQALGLRVQLLIDRAPQIDPPEATTPR